MMQDLEVPSVELMAEEIAAIKARLK